MKTLWLVAALAGCAPVEKAEISFRDQNIPITSIALFEPAKFSGHWDVVGRFGSKNCALEVVNATEGAINLAQKSCLGPKTHSAAQITGPGRFTPTEGANKGVEYWVLWVDQSYRTAVIGTVAGEFGMILNRGLDIPADRLAAARDVLGWNGYDLNRLNPRP